MSSAAARPNLPINLGLAVVALALGGGVAWWGGRKVAMTAMPQMVAIYNGMGGGAAGAIAAVELFGNKAQGATALIMTLLGALIGAVSLSGSLIAWAKLDGVINKPVRVKGQQVFNGLVLLLTVALGAYIVVAGADNAALILTMPTWIYLFFACALALGILMTLPIGGADMPVVISIFNAFTGLAVGIEGYVLQNPALMIAGMVVGAAGMLLTLLMAKAMNRSVSNVIFTNFGDVVDAQAGQDQGQSQAHAAGRRGHRDALCRVGDHRAGLRSRGLARSRQAVRIRQAAADGRRIGEVCGSPGGGPYAGPDGCTCWPRPACPTT